MTKEPPPDFTSHHYMPPRTEMCRQLGTVVLGSHELIDEMPGTYGERWYTLLDMVRDLVKEKDSE